MRTPVLCMLFGGVKADAEQTIVERTNGKRLCDIKKKEDIARLCKQAFEQDSCLCGAERNDSSKNINKSLKNTKMVTII